VKIPAAIAIVILAGLAAAQQPPPAKPGNSQVLWWSGSWDGAFAEAKTRNVCVMVVFIQDGEEANERMVTGIFKDPDFVKLSHKTVPIVTSLQFHGQTKAEVGGVVKAVCTKFGSTTCEAHQQLEGPARVELCGTDVQTPQTVLVTPDKAVVGRIIDLAPISGYQELISKGAKKLGRGLTGAELKQLRDQFRDARARMEKGEWATAIKIAREAQATAKDTPFAKEATAILTQIDEDAKKQIERATAAVAAGDVIGALRILETAVEQFAATDVAAALKKELTRVRGTKAGVDAARILAKEKKGAEAFEAGQAAEKAKDYLTARREYLKAATLAAGTPLAERATGRIDELGKDPDIKPLFERAERDQRAQAALKSAESLLSSGDKEGAKAAFTKILEEFAGSAAAATAKTKLEALR
jgi:hypothetical protein